MHVVEKFCMVLFPFFSSAFLHLSSLHFFFVCVCESGFSFFIKQVYSRTQTQYRQRPPAPLLGPQLDWGLWGPPLAFYVAVFLVPSLASGTRAGGAGLGVLGQVEFVQQLHGEMVTRKDTRTK